MKEKRCALFTLLFKDVMALEDLKVKEVIQALRVQLVARLPIQVS